MGVPASRIEWTEPPLYLKADRWYGPPGAMIKVGEGTGHHTAGFMIACPKCGAIGSAKDGASWTVTGGTIDDVTTLTLSPSIQKGCCGWHGYLRNGVFEEC